MSATRQFLLGFLACTVCITIAVLSFLQGVRTGIHYSVLQIEDALHDAQEHQGQPT